MRLSRVLLVAPVLGLWLAGPAMAQTTGVISGVVFDQAGSPVEGAIVKVSGEMIPAGRTVTTPASGRYAFTFLAPGVYVVEVTKQGNPANKRQTVVEVDKNSTVDMVLGLAVQETVDVSAARPVVDLKSSEVETNYRADKLAALPLERSYAGLFQIIPGVADNRSAIGPSAGGTRQDNTYLLDGASISNPSFGYLSTEVNELDIAEVNVKRAGVSAEFGRAAGVVTNAVTKSGSNRLAGTARLDWQADSLIGGFTSTAFRDAAVVPQVTPAIGIGGPFIKDKLFWYGSARYFKASIGQGLTNKLGTILPTSERTGHELYGKLTGNPTSSMLVNVGYRDRPNHVTNSGLGSNTNATVGNTTDNSARVFTASWAYFIGNRTSLDVKYLYMTEKNDNVPTTALGNLPTSGTPFDPKNLAAMGYVQDQNQQNIYVGGYQYYGTDDYRRHEVKPTFSRFFDLGQSTHNLKVGGTYEFGEEMMVDQTNGWGIIIQTTTNGIPVYRARYFPDQPAQYGQGRTWSMFVQDDITFANRLTINAGLLIDRDDFSQYLPNSGGCAISPLQTVGGAAIYQSSGDTCTFLRFGFSKELQPRLGLTYNLRKDKSDKVYANYGRYYAMDQKSSGRSLAPRRIYQMQTYFNKTTGAVVSSGPLASTTGKLIDPAIEPTYNDEALLGYATPVGKNWSIDTFVMYRKTNNFIEDMPSVWPSGSPYAAANMPCDLWVACQGAVAMRSYKAFTVEVARRLQNKWSATINYTASRFEGNYDLDYAEIALFNTSSIIQDGPGTFVQDPYRYGPLRQDRTHVLKAFATWLPIQNLSLGGYFRLQSGTPWNARAADTQSTSNLNYLEQAGSHRNNAWANFDLLASYTIPLHQQRMSVRLEARVLNLFNTQTALTVDSVKYLDLNTSSAPPYILPYNVPNPAFGTPNSFAPPRRVVLGAIVTF
jgi:hypothetical protein